MSDEQQALLKTMTADGKTREEIGKRLGVKPATVYVWQKRFGIARKERGPIVTPITPELEAEVVGLLRKGNGLMSVHKATGISMPRITRIRDKYRIAPRIQKTPKANEQRFIAALKRREGYIRTLAKKYGVAFCRAKRLAHTTLGKGRFCPGATKPPLSSQYPQKWFKTFNFEQSQSS